MRRYTFESVPRSYHRLVTLLLEEGVEVSPRGMLTKELSPISITITNPRMRLVTHPIRKINPGFAIGELLWILRGSESLDEIKHYNAQWEKFTDDGLILNGAYGKRIFDWESLRRNSDGSHTLDRVDQFQAVVDRLKSDPDSRHGTIAMWDPIRDTKQSKDLPCTNLLRFKLRDNKLDMITFMRSNDIWFGYPYDVFNFTMLQELMAGFLDAEVGTYTHVVDSLHIYDMHFEKAKQLIEYGVADAYKDRYLYDARIREDDFHRLKQNFRILERETRLGNNLEYASLAMLNIQGMNKYWGSLAGYLAMYNLKKAKKADDPFYRAASKIVVNEFDFYTKQGEDTNVSEIKDEVTMKQEKVEQQDAVEDKETSQANAGDTTGSQEGTQDASSEPQIQKIIIETDGTLQNTKIALDDKPVPMLTRVEFLADTDEGIVLNLHQVAVDEEGNAIEEDGKMKINTFTISSKAQGTPVGVETIDPENVAQKASDVAN